MILYMGWSVYGATLDTATVCLQTCTISAKENFLAENNLQMSPVNTAGSRVRRAPALPTTARRSAAFLKRWTCMHADAEHCRSVCTIILGTRRFVHDVQIDTDTIVGRTSSDEGFPAGNVSGRVNIWVNIWVKHAKPDLERACDFVMNSTL